MQNIMMTVNCMKSSDLCEKRIILGLSGGVDSTAAALILKKQGYEVIGLYFNVLSGFCLNHKRNTERGLKKAENAARQLGIRLIYRDMSDEFDKTVVSNFCNEYMNGRTPNPCVICNPEIKFKALTEAADEEGAKYIATGHYADTWMDPETGTWFIKKAANESKDQSYMLYRLSQSVISRLILPLNKYADKEEVRALARMARITNSEDKDSQEICFIDKEDTYLEFLKRKGYNDSAGSFIDADGNFLGKHRGVSAYTVGQRKGLGITLGYPAFVTKIDAGNKTISLGKNESLFSNYVKCTGNILCKRESEVYAKIRYAAKPAKAHLTFEENDVITAEFDEPQRAATPGQSLVFYKDGLVIGGGFIV